MKQWFLNIGFINKLRLATGSYILGKEIRIRERDVKGIGLDESRTIGLIFNAKDEFTFKLIRDFATELRGGGLRDVRALGFVPKAEVATFLQSSQDFDFFSEEDFNWYYKPRGRKVVKFVSEPFDVLIDLRLNRFMPLLFIVGLSRAKFKVGHYGKDHEDYFDLMIKVEENAGLPYFISQIKHYISILNTKA